MIVSKLSRTINYLSKFLDAGFIFRNALVPLLALTLYFFLVSYFLPNGVSKTFGSESWPLVLGLAVLAGVVAFVLWRLKGWKLNGPADRISARDLILLLLPLTPIVQYVLNNQDILSVRESFYILGIFSLVSSVFIFLVPRLLSVAGSSRTLMILGMALAFTLASMPALSWQFSWFGAGGLKIQLAIFGVIFLASWVLYDLNHKKLLYFLIAVYFVSNSVTQVLAPGENRAGVSGVSSKNKLAEVVEGKEPAVTPNIYLLIYDAYPHNETMKQYGVDNSTQEKYLEKKGFKLYPKTFSVGGSSVGTMSRILNASSEYYGNIRKGVSGDGVVQGLLKNISYETGGVFTSDYFFRGIGSRWDFSFPSDVTPSADLLFEAVLTGEFRFDLEFDKVPHEQFVAEKLALWRNPDNPRFVYMHTNLPAHSQNSGSCLPNEVELFKERLEEANTEMRGDIETIVNNDSGAIVIVAGDHGPYLTKNCTLTGDRYDISEISRLDIQDRFGTFLAIRWPDSKFEAYDGITVLQDLFPAVFAYLFKDERILDAKIEPKTLEPERISGAEVRDGIIYGGINDGEPLFTTSEK
ncbi:MAG: hypothetical protein WD897_00765 [Parcubacteria group bacterium]